jgi:hypothetical protein
MKRELSTQLVIVSTVITIIVLLTLFFMGIVQLSL